MTDNLIRKKIDENKIGNFVVESVLKCDKTYQSKPHQYTCTQRTHTRKVNERNNSF